MHKPAVLTLYKQIHEKKAAAKLMSLQQLFLLKYIKQASGCNALYPAYRLSAAAVTAAAVSAAIAASTAAA